MPLLNQATNTLTEDQQRVQRRMRDFLCEHFVTDKLFDSVCGEIDAMEPEFNDDGLPKGARAFVSPGYVAKEGEGIVVVTPTEVKHYTRSHRLDPWQLERFHCYDSRIELLNHIRKFQRPGIGFW